ncbi:MAG: Eco57I restriction-modification methylase domain-containing protein [Promethearchaeota archaeon]
MNSIERKFSEIITENRANIAHHIKNSINFPLKLIMAQRFLNRLIFLYFIGLHGLIKYKNSQGSYYNLDWKQFLITKIRDQNFQQIIDNLYFGYFSQKYPKDSVLVLGTTFKFPNVFFKLNEIKIKVQSGYISEREILIKKFDWKELVTTFNGFNWCIELQEKANLDLIEKKTLFPDILSYLYENFVISLDELEGRGNNSFETSITNFLDKKRRLGVFYTPVSIANFIAKQALIYTLVKFTRTKEIDIFPKKADKISNEEKNEITAFFKTIRVLDPAVGSGSLLLAVADLLFDYRKQLEPHLSDFQIKTEIVTNLFGVDVLETAIEICKLRFLLWLLSSIQTRIGTKYKHELIFKIKTGNSLLGFINHNSSKNYSNLTEDRNTLNHQYLARWSTKLFKEKRSKALNCHSLSNSQISKLKIFHWFLEFNEVFDRPKHEKGFHLIVGNPPYGAKFSTLEKQLIKKVYPGYNRINNSVAYFYARVQDLLIPNGLLGLIVPNTLAFYSTWQPLRDLILSAHELLVLCDLGIAFKGVNHEQLAIIASKNQSKAQITSNVKLFCTMNHKNACNSKKPIYLGEVSQALMSFHKRIIYRPINKEEKGILEFLYKNCNLLREVYLSEGGAQRGLYISNQVKNSLKDGNTLFVNRVPDVQAFKIQKFRTIELPKLSSGDLLKIEKMHNPRIFFKVLRGKRVVAHFDLNGDFLTTEKLVNIYPKSQFVHLIPALTLLLNSQVPSFYFEKMIFSEVTETSRVMDDPYVGELPIKIPDNALVAGSVETLNWLAEILFFLGQYLRYVNEEIQSEAENIFSELQKLANGICYEWYFWEKFSNYAPSLLEETFQSLKSHNLPLRMWSTWKATEFAAWRSNDYQFARVKGREFFLAIKKWKSGFLTIPKISTLLERIFSHLWVKEIEKFFKKGK